MSYHVSCAYPCLGQENVDDKPLVNPGEFDTLDALSPASQEYNIYMLENLPPKYKTYLGTCADKMGPSGISECNEDVLREILTNKPVSRECCLMVVRAGKECYMEIRKLMFRLYQLKRFASQVFFKTNEVWNRCSAEVEMSCAYPCLGQEDVDDKPLVNPGDFDTLDALSPASQEYNIYMLENLPPKYKTYLGTCADKMGPSGISECNEDVLREILTNKPVSRECCLMVVRAGKECYMEIRKFMFRLYQLKRFASQVSFKSNEVWNRCSAEVESPSSSHDHTILYHVSCVYPCLGQEDVDDKPLVNPGEFDTLDALSPASQEYNIYMLENLPPKYKTYLGTCADKMGPSGISECNEDVLREILTNKPVSRECCLMVVRAGKECYMEIRKFMFRLYQLKRLASQVSFKTIEVWNRCSAKVERPNMKIPDNGFSEQDVVDTSGDNGGSRSYGDGQLVSEEIDGVLL
ncbi:hypothetical protein HID58_044314, partial [Brassica napus]